MDVISRPDTKIGIEGLTEAANVLHQGHDMGQRRGILGSAEKERDQRHRIIQLEKSLGVRKLK